MLFKKLYNNIFIIILKVIALNLFIEILLIKLSKMILNNLLSKFSSQSKVGNYNTLISNGMINFINNILDVNLCNLNLLEDEFRNYSWYIDIFSGKIYHLLVSLDNNYLQLAEKDNYNLLNKIRKINTQKLD